MDHGIPGWSERARAEPRTYGVADEAGIQLHGSGFAIPRRRARWKRFHGAWNGLCACARRPASSRKPGWISFRWEHNHVRPHEALGMQTPASVWYRSERPYDPHPPRWEYPPGAKVLKVSSPGQSRCLPNTLAIAAHWRASGYN